MNGKGDVPSDRIPTVAGLLQRWVPYFAWSVIAIALFVLLGWGIGSTALKSILPGMITMKVNTAIGLGLLAGALLGLNSEQRGWRISVVVCLFTVTAFSLMTLAEYLLGVNLHIDNLLFYDHISARFPGRNAPATNFAFLGLVTAFTLLRLRRSIGVAQVILLVVAAAPLATWGGYLYGAPGMYQNAPYPVIALNTSIALMFLCVGGLFACCDGGLMRIVTSDSLSGSLARKLLPAAAGVPLLTGLLVMLGQRAHWYTPEFGSAMLVACCGIFFALVVSWTITILFKSEMDLDRLRQSEREALAVAERANRMKDEFLSVVSHELRTPLNAILGWSQILRMNDDPADLPLGLETIDRNAKAQVQIIEDLLDMGRIISGKVRLEIQPVEMPAVIQLATDSMRPAANAKGVKLELTLAMATGPVSGDADRLQQVIWNLLSNAIKFTPTGGVVRVGLERADHHVEVTVSDTGEGIEGDFLPYVFERFRQADASSTRRYGGLGLGLSIVKNIVELHGGTVTAASEGRGHGATFCVKLPLVPAKREVKSPPHPPAGNIFRQTSLRGLQVLVVDDEPDARATAKRLLEACDATATVASSVDEAMNLLGESKRTPVFDVIISDIGMPRRDGFDLIRSVRNLPTDRGGRTPALALTAYAGSEDRARAMLAGFDVHLSKPVDPGDLCAAVAQLAGRGPVGV